MTSGVGWGGQLHHQIRVGNPGTSHQVWLPSLPRKLPVLSNLSDPGGTGAGPGSFSRVLTGAASTMDTSWALRLFLLMGESPAQPFPSCPPPQQPPTASPPLFCSLRSRGPRPHNLFWSSANQFLFGLRELFPGPGFKSSLHQTPELEISGSVFRFQSLCRYSSFQMDT